MARYHGDPATGVGAGALRIAKSDIVILTAAVFALLFSLSRWSELDPPNRGQASLAAPPSETSSGAPTSTRETEPATSAAERSPPPAAATGESRPSSPVLSSREPTGASGSTTAAAPGGSGAADDEAPSDSRTDTLEEGVHVVVSGDTLGALAERFGTSTASLQELNSLDGTLIVVGQELRYRRDGEGATQ